MHDGTYAACAGLLLHAHAPAQHGFPVVRDKSLRGNHCLVSTHDMHLCSLGRFSAAHACSCAALAACIAASASSS
eukprot:1157384-Pelagomonas_calceolata.AAC.2